MPKYTLLHILLLIPILPTQVSQAPFNSHLNNSLGGLRQNPEKSAQLQALQKNKEALCDEAKKKMNEVYSNHEAIENTQELLQKLEKVYNNYKAQIEKVCKAMLEVNTLGLGSSDLSDSQTKALKDD
ncbi:MAG: hypothetical protein AAF380_00640 [Bacteroidota bacterium]